MVQDRSGRSILSPVTARVDTRRGRTLVRALALGLVLVLGVLATRTGLAEEAPADAGAVQEPPSSGVAGLGPLPAVGIAAGADLGTWTAPDVARQLDDYVSLNAAWIR